jgi:hypothetical protein
MQLTLPYHFTLRPYQKALWNALFDDKRAIDRAVVIWHRRAGKDKVFLNILAAKAFQRVGTYFYILPFYTQARKIIWEGYDKDGFRNIDHFPPPLVAHRHNQEMVLELKNGSFIRFLGSDNIDSIVGTNPIGIVFSEFSLHKPQAWDYMRPILLENGGFAIFNGTPRGKNHLWTMYQTALQNPSWYSEVLTIADTGVMTSAQVEDEIRLGMPRALAQQEFYCSFEAALTGAYFAEVMNDPARVAKTPYNPSVPVWTSWDLGIDDETVVWFFQSFPGSFNIINCMAEHGRSLVDWVRLLQSMPYVYSHHILPHDVSQRELSSGQRRIDTLRSLGLRDVRIAPKLPVEDGINAARHFLALAQIDPQCGKGIEALKTYRCDYDADSGTYGKPVHDWSSHYADALRMAALCTSTSPTTSTVHQAQLDYNPLNYFKSPSHPHLDQLSYHGYEEACRGFK